MDSLNVLALNSGSSSLKFGLYRVDSSGAERLFGESVATAAQPDAITQVTRVLADAGMPPPQAIGHRIVHGGAARRQHCVIDAGVIAQLVVTSRRDKHPAFFEQRYIRRVQSRFFLDGQLNDAGPG